MAALRVQKIPFEAKATLPRRLTSPPSKSSRPPKPATGCLSLPPTPAAFRILTSPTLIIGLENTLVHFAGKNAVFVRPFAEQFLSEIHRYFDVIVLSNLEEDLVQSIVNRIDPESKWIQNVILLNAWADADVLEELRLSGLFGERSIILKTPKDTVLGKSKNEIAVPFWDKNDAKDRVLKDLLPILKGIVQLKVSDVEEYLRGIREQMIVNVGKGSLTPYAHVVRSERFLE